VPAGGPVKRETVPAGGPVKRETVPAGGPVKREASPGRMKADLRTLWCVRCRVHHTPTGMPLVIITKFGESRLSAMA